MNKGYVLIRGNRLVAHGYNLDTLAGIANNGDEHATIYDLNSMTCVREFNAFKPLNSECDTCGATL